MAEELIGRVWMPRLFGVAQAVPFSEPATYLLITGDGTEIPAVFVEDEVIFTATAADIRAGKTAATTEGVTVGTMRSGGGNLQKKTVAPTQKTQIVTADAGYDGMSVVNVQAAPLQAKTAVLTTEQQTITADPGQYGLSSVTIPAYGYGNIEKITMEQEDSTITVTASMVDGSEVEAIVTLDSGGIPSSVSVDGETFTVDMGGVHGQV